jgi:hypothetical protein
MPLSHFSVVLLSRDFGLLFLAPDNAFVGYETDYAVIDNVLSLRP